MAMADLELCFPWRRDGGVEGAKGVAGHCVVVAGGQQHQTWQTEKHRVWSALTRPDGGKERSGILETSIQSRCGICCAGGVHVESGPLVTWQCEIDLHVSAKFKIALHRKPLNTTLCGSPCTEKFI